MIEFDCPHCRKRLFHQEEFAGRDGWCRFCKGIILIPQPGQAAPVLNLTPEQQYARLERMFKHAASIVDEHRQLQSRLRNGGTGLVEELRLRTEAQREAETLNARVEQAAALQRTAQEECEQLRARINELDAYGAELRHRLDTDATERAGLEENLEEARAEAERVPELEAEQAETRAALDEQIKENDSLLERLLDVEQSLETATALADKAASAWSAERDSFEQRLKHLRDELCDAEDEGATLKEKLGTADEAASQLQKDLNAANASTAEEQERLQDEIDRLTSALEAETEAHAETEKQLIEALPIADRLPALEETLKDARAEMKSGEERYQTLERQAAETDRALELAEKRGAEARAAWESQRQQLVEEIETIRAAQRAAEDETTAVRANGREAAAELQSQLDALQANLANESRLRIAAEDSRQHLLRRATEAETAFDGARSRSELASRQLESAQSDLGEARQEATQLREAAAEAEASAQALKLRLTDAQTERDAAIERREALSSELDAAQRVSAQLRTRIVELDHGAATAQCGMTESLDAQVEPLRAEVERLKRNAEHLEEALEASRQEKTRLEQRLVTMENRAAYSELEGVGYRSKFSSMAKQFFEQEVARLTDAQDAPPTEPDRVEHVRADDGESAAVLEAVAQLRP